MQLNILQNINILQLSKNFDWSNNKQFSFSAKEKSFFKLLPNIMPIDYFAIDTINISNIK